MKEITIGVIVNTHALKGEVKVKIITDFPQLRFTKKAHMYVTHENVTKELIIKSVRTNKDMFIVAFEGYDDINVVEPLKGCKLFVYEDQLQPLADDEAYYFEMMHAHVYDMEDQFIGDVEEVIETGANVVLRVVQGEKHTLLPFVKAFVKEFDKKEKIMHVEMMDGL